MTQRSPRYGVADRGWATGSSRCVPGATKTFADQVGHGRRASRARTSRAGRRRATGASRNGGRAGAAGVGPVTATPTPTTTATRGDQRDDGRLVGADAGGRQRWRRSPRGRSRGTTRPRRGRAASGPAGRRGRRARAAPGAGCVPCRGAPGAPRRPTASSTRTPCEESRTRSAVSRSSRSWWRRSTTTARVRPGSDRTNAHAAASPSAYPPGGTAGAGRPQGGPRRAGAPRAAGRGPGRRRRAGPGRATPAGAGPAPEAPGPVPATSSPVSSVASRCRAGSRATNQEPKSEPMTVGLRVPPCMASPCSRAAPIVAPHTTVHGGVPHAAGQGGDRPRQGRTGVAGDHQRPGPRPGRGRGRGPGVRGLPHRPALPGGRHQRRLPVPARPRGRRRRRVGRAGRRRASSPATSWC